jgi:hypothetical protein
MYQPHITITCGVVHIRLRTMGFPIVDPKYCKTSKWVGAATSSYRVSLVNRNKSLIVEYSREEGSRWSELLVITYVYIHTICLLSRNRMVGAKSSQIFSDCCTMLQYTKRRMFEGHADLFNTCWFHLAPLLRSRSPMCTWQPTLR